MRLVEKRYGIRQNEPPAPEFCPLCGRRLEHGFWDTVEKDRRYHYRCCFGGSWLAPLYRHPIFRITTPLGGIHYLWENLEPEKLAQPVARYDRMTGERL